MKNTPRILGVAVIVGLLAAIPASTQGLSGVDEETSADSLLPMLLLVNRLELSEAQMQALVGIFSDLLAQREQVVTLRSGFEDEMIRFQGSSEELDALLEAYRDEQAAAIDTLAESLADSLDQIGDLLTLNQGQVLGRALPGLLNLAIQGQGQSFPTVERAAYPSAARMGRRMNPSIVEPRSRLLQQRTALGQTAGTETDENGQNNDGNASEALCQEGLPHGRQLSDQAQQRLQQRTEQENVAGVFSGLRRAHATGVTSTLKAGDTMRMTTLGEPGRLLDVLQHLVEVLNLKLEAMN